MDDLLPFDDGNRQAAQLQEQAKPAVDRWTVRIVAFGGESPDGGVENLGTGVLVQVGTEVLLATVAHVLQGGPKLAFEFSTDERPCVRAVAEARGTEGYYRDVGFIRFERSVQPPAPLPLHRLDCRPSTPARDGLLVVGYPQALASRGGPRGEGLTLLSYPLEEFEVAGLERDVDRYAGLIYFDCRRDAYSTAGGAMVVPALEGASGGGVWTLGYSDNPEAWSPEADLRLVGLQRSVDKNGEFGRVEPIRNWLDFVASERPDLRSVVTDWVRNSLAMPPSPLPSRRLPRRRYRVPATSV